MTTRLKRLIAIGYLIMPQRRTSGFQIASRAFLRRVCGCGRALPLFAFAYGLPPKISEQNYPVVNGPARTASAVEILSAQPVLHGGMILSKEGVLVLNGDASRALEFGAPGQSPVEKNVESEKRDAVFARNREFGAFRVQDEKLSFRPDPQMAGDLWSVQLGFEALGLASHSATAWLTGWGAYPAKLFAFPPDRRTLIKINWGSDSEPVYFAPCDARQAILIENLKNGQTRAVFFENARPRASTLFDFSSNKLLSTATAAAVRSCDEFFVAGSFGVVRVRYRK